MHQFSNQNDLRELNHDDIERFVSYKSIVARDTDRQNVML